MSIVNRKLETLADQRFDQRHDRRLAQIVSTGLETETEHADALLAAADHHLDRAFNLQTITRQDRRKHRHLDVELFRLIVDRAQVFRQTRAAKRETRLEVLRRKVQLRVLAKNL